MVPIISIVSSLLDLYMFILVVRVVLDWVQVFARSWRPRGIVLVLANVVYGLTDPPLRRLRQVVPVLRLGGVGVDLSFLALFFGILVIQSVLWILV
ncbi:YggT family protein [Actinomyces oricola]|uniref:YggT family protein n=1 Tax=Actinomyces oricola TaxID=206043 RepID=UPI003BAAACB7